MYSRTPTSTLFVTSSGESIAKVDESTGDVLVAIVSCNAGHGILLSALMRACKYVGAMNIGVKT